MKTVYSDTEAMKWFLENHSGSVKCSCNGVELVVGDYGSANKFFREQVAK